MIFCVEDDSSIRELMLYALQSAGFEGKGFPHGEALFQGLGAQVPEFFRLVIMLAGVVGVSILNSASGPEGDGGDPRHHGYSQGGGV